MFFKKNNSQENEESVSQKWIKKMDAIVTGAILGGVVASLYWVKKLKESKKNPENQNDLLDNSSSEKSGFFNFFKKWNH